MSLQYRRIFVSINLTTTILNGIKDTIRFLQIDFPKGVRWIRPETAHVTVHFVGEMPENILGNFIKKLGEVTPGWSPFTLFLGSPEVIPSLKRPRVIWIPLDGDLEEMQNMSFGVRNVIKNCGIDLNARGFVPHITLGRIFQPKCFNNHGAVAKRLQQYVIRANPQSLEVSEIAIVQSVLHQSGPIYTNRKKYPISA